MKLSLKITGVFLLLMLISAYAFACNGGRNNRDGTNAPPPKDAKKAGDPFNPYTGNEQREVTDINVWGSIGVNPLKLTRYFNSRVGTFSNQFGNDYHWNHNYNYTMYDDGLDTNGAPQIVIAFPEGGQYLFTRNSLNNSLWLPADGVGMRLFQNGNTFNLQTEKGFIYHFERFAATNGFYYQLLEIKDYYQNIYTLTYNDSKRLLRVTEPAGRYLKFYYSLIDGKKYISKVSSSDGRDVIYNYNVVNDNAKNWVSLVGVDYGDNTHAFYSYSQLASGLNPDLVHAVDPRVNGVTTNIKFTYSTTIPGVSGFILEERNGITNDVLVTLTPVDSSLENIVCYANGRTQIYYLPTSYQGSPEKYSDGLGRVTKYTYQNINSGFLLSETDALKRTTTYDARTIYGNPLLITYHDGTTESWTRDALDLILTHTDESGRTTTYTRDANHRVVQISYPDGSFESFTYNSYGQPLEHHQRNGGISYTTYDVRGLKTVFTDALGNQTLYTYNSNDLVASVTDARGNTTYYDYNERGLVTKITNADASFVSYGYDDYGNRTTITDELGHTTISTYDEFKRPVTHTDALNRVTSYFYDMPGATCGCASYYDNPTKIILPSGKIVEMEYDVEWNKISESKGAGTSDAATTLFEYDRANNLIKMIDAKGKEWNNEFDERNRVKSKKDPLLNETKFIRDDVGNITSEIKPDGSRTNTIYDNMNRVISIRNANSETTKFEFDAAGNMVKLKDAKGNEYNFEFDLMERKTKMIFPGGKFESYTYDQVGNKQTFTNRAGDVCTYTYDNRNRNTFSDWNTNNTSDVTTSFDMAGRLLTMANNASTLTYTYNDANELISEQQNINGEAAKTIQYTYDNDQNRSTATYPSGNVLNYTYNSRNNLSSISVDGNTLVSYEYDFNDNITNKALENNTTATYVYNDANRLLSLDNKKSITSFAKFDYGYDNGSRITFEKRDNDKGDVYSFDAIDQITNVQYNVTNPDSTPINPTKIVDYYFDALGNRDSITENGLSTIYNVNNKNQYTSAGGDAITYDIKGNLKTQNGWVYSYDAINRMIKAVDSNTIILFDYDALNRCVKRTINGVKTVYYYDGWSLITEREAGNPAVTKYFHGATTDELIKKVYGGISSYYCYDGVGNVIGLTNSNGNITEKYSYDIYGSPVIKDGNGNVIDSSAFENRFMFQGREYISQLRLYDYRNRVYNPTLGRFLQIDPILFESGDYNLYRFCFNNTLKFSDPFGLTGSKKSDTEKEIEEENKRRAEAEAKRQREADKIRKMLERIQRALSKLIADDPYGTETPTSHTGVRG